MDVPSIIFWVLMGAGLRSRGPLMLYIFFGLLPFETTAVVPPALVGGVTFTPGWMATAFLTLKLILLHPSLSGALSPLRDLRCVGLLSGCTLYGILSAIFLPRLFQGRVDVFAMRGVISIAVPLQPSPANITQTFYFIMTTLGVLSFYLSASALNMKRHLFNAILFGGVVVVLAGMADIATSALGLGAILAPFRTATYGLLVDSDILGAKRVVGLCSEASAYAGLCMSFAAPVFFLRGAFQKPLTREVLAPLVFACLITMLAISTSSTGYVGLAALGVTIVVHSIWQSMKGRSSGPQNFALVCGVATALFTVFVVKADILSKATQMIDVMVFHKTMSLSYIERQSWNTTTFQAFLHTYWLGAGLGSARASSWIISILGNIGAIGAALMLAFLVLTFLSSPPPGRTREEEIATGAKAALVPMLAMASLAGTAVGFGLMPACMFGLIGAVSWRPVRAVGRPRLAVQRQINRGLPASTPIVAPRSRF